MTTGRVTAATATTLTGSEMGAGHAANDCASLWIIIETGTWGVSGPSLYGLVMSNTSGPTPVYTVDRWYNAATPGGAGGIPIPNSTYVVGPQAVLGPVFVVDYTFVIKGRGPVIVNKVGLPPDTWKVGDLLECGDLRARIIGIEYFAIVGAQRQQALLLDIDPADTAVGQIWRLAPVCQMWRLAPAVSRPTEPEWAAARAAAARLAARLRP